MEPVVPEEPVKPVPELPEESVEPAPVVPELPVLPKVPVVPELPVVPEVPVVSVVPVPVPCANTGKARVEASTMEHAAAHGESNFEIMVDLSVGARGGAVVASAITGNPRS